MNDGLYALLAFISGFIIAQLAKCIIYTIAGKRQKKMQNFGQIVRYITRSGGMPSGHSASCVALTTYLGFSQGFTSVIFALSLCVTIIFIYDAVNVRYAVGEQGKILTKIIKSQHQIIPKPHIVEGHTIPQVVIGSIIGIVIGWLIFVIFGG